MPIEVKGTGMNMLIVTQLERGTEKQKVVFLRSIVTDDYIMANSVDGSLAYRAFQFHDEGERDQSR